MAQQGVVGLPVRVAVVPFAAILAPYDGQLTMILVIVGFAVGTGSGSGVRKEMK